MIVSFVCSFYANVALGLLSKKTLYFFIISVVMMALSIIGMFFGESKFIQIKM